MNTKNTKNRALHKELMFGQWAKPLRPASNNQCFVSKHGVPLLPATDVNAAEYHNNFAGKAVPSRIGTGRILDLLTTVTQLAQEHQTFIQTIVCFLSCHPHVAEQIRALRKVFRLKFPEIKLTLVIERKSKELTGVPGLWSKTDFVTWQQQQPVSMLGGQHTLYWSDSQALLHGCLARVFKVLPSRASSAELLHQLTDRLPCVAVSMGLSLASSSKNKEWAQLEGFVTPCVYSDPFALGVMFTTYKDIARGRLLPKSLRLQAWRYHWFIRHWQDSRTGPTVDEQVLAEASTGHPGVHSALRALESHRDSLDPVSMRLYYDFTHQVLQEVLHCLYTKWLNGKVCVVVDLSQRPFTELKVFLDTVSAHVVAIAPVAPARHNKADNPTPHLFRLFVTKDRVDDVVAWSMTLGIFDRLLTGKPQDLYMEHEYQTWSKPVDEGGSGDAYFAKVYEDMQRKEGKCQYPREWFVEHTRGGGKQLQLYVRYGRNPHQCCKADRANR